LRLNRNNIAVIGCGHWGKNLVRNFAELGALAAVCDPNSELAQHCAKQYKVNDSTFAEIINNANIEGVVLAVPAPLHASLAIEAMNAGKHVYVEKPLAMNQIEARQMIDTSKDRGVQLMVGHLLQYHPVFIAVRELVESGELGGLSYIYSNRLSFGKVRSEEDVIWSFAPHDISMILSLTGQEPELVRTESSSILQANIADTATVHMEFKSTLKAHISVSWLHPYKEQKLVVIGKSAMAVFDDTQPWGQKLALYRHNIDLTGKAPSLEKSDVEYIDVAQSEPLKNECQHFIDAVNGRLTPLTNGDEGLRVLNVLSAATLSQNENNVLRLERKPSLN
jgi:UDP-2-acetamido-3-amino-2,3-dideoxy-glucuronate N-acetyltransferase